MRWLTNFYHFRNQQLQLEFEYTLLKPDCHSWWISKFNLNFRRTICNKILRIKFYLLRTFCPHLGRVFLCCFFFHYVWAKFHLWPSSGDLPWPRIGMLSLVTVSPVITAFHSCCLSHNVFDQVNFWLVWVGFETAIFWQPSRGTKKKNYQDEDKKSAINKN